MLNKKERAIREILASLNNRIRSKLRASRTKRLVGYRSEAAKTAQQRVLALQRIADCRPASLDAVFRCEQYYHMMKMRLLAASRFSGQMPILACTLSGFCTVGFGWIVLFLGLHHRYAGHSLGLLLMALAPFILGPLACLSIWSLLCKFRAELRGLSDSVRSRGLRKRLVSLTLGCGFYFFFFGIAPVAVENMTMFKDGLFFALSVIIFGGIGLFGFSVGFWTLLAVAWVRQHNRSVKRLLAIAVPVETIVHEMLSSILLIGLASGNRLSPSKQRRLCRHFESSAYAVERGLRQQFEFGDRETSTLIAIKTQGVANGFRDLKRWVATPMADTNTHLLDRVCHAMEAAALGDLDALPLSDRPALRKSALKDSFSMLCVICLAGCVSAFMAWLLGAVLGIPSSAIATIFIALMPLLSSYLINLILPDFSPRRSSVS